MPFKRYFNLGLSAFNLYSTSVPAALGFALLRAPSSHQPFRLPTHPAAHPQLNFW